MPRLTTLAALAVQRRCSSVDAEADEEASPFDAFLSLSATWDGGMGTPEPSSYLSGPLYSLDPSAKAVSGGREGGVLPICTCEVLLERADTDVSREKRADLRKRLLLDYDMPYLKIKKGGAEEVEFLVATSHSSSSI